MNHRVGHFILLSEPDNPFPDINLFTIDASKKKRFEKKILKIILQHPFNKEGAMDEIEKLKHPLTKERFDQYRALLLYEYYHYLCFGYRPNLRYRT